MKLSELLKQNFDIEGYVSDPFGDGPTFVLTRVLLADGRAIFVEGEHDTPYLGDIRGILQLPWPPEQEEFDYEHDGK